MVLETDSAEAAYHCTGTSNNDLRTGFAFANHRLGLRGNACVLRALTSSPAQIPDFPNRTTGCLTWPDAQQGSFAVQCYNSQQLIQCCGHGLLMAADYWLQETGYQSLSLNMNGSKIKASLELDADSGDSQQSKICLHFSDISITPVAVPDWLKEELGLAGGLWPIAAAHIGDDQGYLVLQFADNTDLKTLPAPQLSVASYSQRAIIYTSALSNSEQTNSEQSSCEQLNISEGHINLRYFAPQYGVAEDVATGSAMRVLARYWADRFTSLHGFQQSSVGGELFSTIDEKGIVVKGYCNWSDDIE